MDIYDSQGRQALLKKIIGKGGEGTIYDIEDRPELAAKIYHQPPDDKMCQKLFAMTKVKDDRLLKISAWPVSTLHNELDGPVIGLLMPKINNYKEIHKLYSPKTRIVEFPQAGWDFIIHAAANLARAFSVIHERGHVIGDVNQGNIVVSDKAMVMLIDCDSYQVAADGCMYPCNVGVPIYQPPELQDIKSFAGVVRTPNHDNFSLAVMIFHLLFMGRHPFSGRYTGPGEMPLERAIKEHRFVYDKLPYSMHIKQPPGTLSLSAVPNIVASLFRQAFLTDKRPDARAWIAALDSMAKQLKQCSKNPSHKYSNTLKECSWCRIEENTGAVLFSIISFKKPPDFEGLIMEMEKIPHPDFEAPEERTFNILPSKEYKKYRTMRKLHKILCFAAPGAALLTLICAPKVVPLWSLAFIGAFCIIGILKPVPENVMDRAKNEYFESKKRLNECLDRLRTEAGDRQYKIKKSEIISLYNTYKCLEEERKKRILNIKPGSILSREEINKIDSEFVSESNKIFNEISGRIQELKAIPAQVLDKKQELMKEVERCSMDIARARANLKALGCSIN